VEAEELVSRSAALAFSQAYRSVLLERSAVNSDSANAQICELGEIRGEPEKQAHAAPVAESTPF